MTAMLIRLYAPDPTYDTDKEGSHNAILLEALKVETAGAGDIVDAGHANLGAGADWPGFFVELAGFTAALFFLGKKIDENVQAWISLAGKIGTAACSISAKFRRCFLDHRGACAVALAWVFEEYPLSSICA